MGGWVWGVVGPIAFVSSWVVAGAVRAGYDARTQAISRLAEAGASNRWIVTSGMVVFGAAALLFAPTLFRWGLRVASVLVALAGASALAVAASPCTAGCPGWGAVGDNAHIVAAGIHYVCFCSAPIAAVLELRDRMPRFAAYCFATVAGAGAALTLHVVGVGPTGLMQRIGLTTADVWLVATAIVSGRCGRPEARAKSAVRCRM